MRTGNTRVLGICVCAGYLLLLYSGALRAQTLDNQSSVTAPIKINTLNSPPGPLVLEPLEGEAATKSAKAIAATAEKEPTPMQSLMMTPEVLKEIHMATDIYNKYSNNRQQDITQEERTFMTQIIGLSGGQPGVKKRETKRYAYPQYFLESLEYHSPTDWLVQISGRKIAQDTVQDKANVRVVDVSKEQIKLEWKPMMLEKFTDHIPNPPDPNVEVNKEKGTILITLRQHQTFTSYVMRVVEGKVVPKIITAEVGDFPDGQEISGPVDATSPDKKPIPAGASDDNQGMTGLINQYQGKKP